MNRCFLRWIHCAIIWSILLCISCINKWCNSVPNTEPEKPYQMNNNQIVYYKHRTTIRYNIRMDERERDRASERARGTEKDQKTEAWCMYQRMNMRRADVKAKEWRLQKQKHTILPTVHYIWSYKWNEGSLGGLLCMGTLDQSWLMHFNYIICMCVLECVQHIVSKILHKHILV